MQISAHEDGVEAADDSFEETLLVALENANIDEPCGRVIEDVARFASVSKRAILAVGRFACSNLLENRYSSVWARVQLGQSEGVELEAICLHALGITHADPAVRVGTISLLSQLAVRGNQRAQTILDLLHLDANWCVANLNTRE